MKSRSQVPGGFGRPGIALFVSLVLIIATGCAGFSAATSQPAPTLPVQSSLLAPAVQAVQPTIPTQSSSGTESAVSARTLDAAAALTSTAPAATPAPQARVETMPDPASAAWKPFAEDLSSPVDMAAPKDGSGNLLVVERTGRIQLLVNGKKQAEPFLDLSGKITAAGTEQGLLGIALHPDYVNNGFFYVNYTDTKGDTVISRFTRSADPNKADSASEKILIRQDQPYPNHNGGSVRFGPDGLLYLGLGDGGSAGDPHGNAQNPDSILGKILRIDVNQGDPYAIPAGNLYAAGAGRPEVWAMGLRNPWRLSFDPGNGDLYIGDVGQNQWEEIDLYPAGSSDYRNFGWNYFEGSHPYKGSPPAGTSTIPPVFEYDHGNGCSVTGGEVYNGQMLPQWRGVYLFADYCSGNVWGLLKGSNGIQSALLYQSGASVSSFGTDQNGELYMLDLNGRILRLEPAR